MKKLILIFSLIASVFVFGQAKEVSYIYKNIMILKNDQVSHYKTPVQVTYFNANENVIKVSFKDRDYYYTIVGEPVKKYDGLYYFQVKVRDGAGNIIDMVLFEDVGRYGCVFSDGKITISYSNTDLNNSQ